MERSLDSYDEEVLANRKPGDMKPSLYSSLKKKSHNFSLRFYGLWRSNMWNVTGYSGVKHTIESVLKDKQYDFAFLNIAAHHQDPIVSVGEKAYTQFLGTVAQKYNQDPNMIPLIWVSMTAQYAPKKKNDIHRYQNHHISKIYNEWAHWYFGNYPHPPIGVLDFHDMMAAGFPDTSVDGIHATREFCQLQWHATLTLLCPNGTLSTETLIPPRKALF